MAGGAVAVGAVVGATVVAGAVVGGATVVGTAVGRRRGRHRLVELPAEVVLGPGLLEAGAPQLVGGEEQHEHAEDDEDAAEPPDPPSPTTHLSDGTGWLSEPGSSGRGPRRPVARHGARMEAAEAWPVLFPTTHGAGDPPSRSRGAPRALPGSGRRDARRRAAARSCSSGARTAPASPPCCGCCAGLVAVTSGEAVVLGHDLRADRRSGAPPGRACSATTTTSTPT